MKTIIKSIALGLFLLLMSVQSNAKTLQAMLSYATFWSPANNSYLETYLAVSGNSIACVKNASNKYQGTIEVTMIFKQNDVVKDFKKFNLLSPEIEDTLNSDFNFIDQQRFALPSGIYDFEITIADLNQKGSKFSTVEKENISFSESKIVLSGTQLVESVKPTTDVTILSKSGYDLVPYVFDFYPENIKKLTFYAEIYNAQKVLGDKEAFLVSAFIESFETGKALSNFLTNKREAAKLVNPVLMNFDISKLPSGNYNLVIEVRDKKNQLLETNKTFFQRSNPSVQFEISDLSSVAVENTFVAKYSNIDTLRDYVKSLSPIATESERGFIRSYVKSSDITTLQQFFLSFWLNRSATEPMKLWFEYNTQVESCDRMFGMKVKKGYETDRGRVYLQYGPPNSIDESKSEPWAYPYQIWQYYTLKNQSNKKFVFYNTNFAGNDYELLHSDALGEVYNSQWQLMLHSKMEPTNNPDQRDVTPHWGSKSSDYWNNRK